MPSPTPYNSTLSIKQQERHRQSPLLSSHCPTLRPGAASPEPRNRPATNANTPSRRPQPRGPPPLPPQRRPAAATRPRRGCSAWGRRRQRAGAALPHAVAGPLPAPRPAPPPLTLPPVGEERAAGRRGPAQAERLGVKDEEPEGDVCRPAPRDTWHGAGGELRAGRRHPPTPSRPAAWQRPSGLPAPPGHRRRSHRRAARGRPGVWFLPAEEGGLWGGSRSREPPPRSRRG